MGVTLFLLLVLFVRHHALRCCLRRLLLASNYRRNPLLYCIFCMIEHHGLRLNYRHRLPHIILLHRCWIWLIDHWSTCRWQSQKIGWTLSHWRAQGWIRTLIRIVRRAQQYLCPSQFSFYIWQKWWINENVAYKETTNNLLCTCWATGFCCYILIKDLKLDYFKFN